jgi:hypothetical protein
MSDEKRDVIDFCKKCSLWLNHKCTGVSSEEQMRKFGCITEM